jgi:hypothetical protein
MLRPRRCPSRSRICPSLVCPGTRCTASTAAQRTKRLPGLARSGAVSRTAPPAHQRPHAADGAGHDQQRDRQAAPAAAHRHLRSTAGPERVVRDGTPEPEAAAGAPRHPGWWVRGAVDRTARPSAEQTHESPVTPRPDPQPPGWAAARATVSLRRRTARCPFRRCRPVVGRRCCSPCSALRMAVAAVRPGISHWVICCYRCGSPRLAPGLDVSQPQPVESRGWVRSGSPVGSGAARAPVAKELIRGRDTVLGTTGVGVHSRISRLNGSCLH